MIICNTFNEALNELIKFETNQNPTYTTGDYLSSFDLKNINTPCLFDDSECREYNNIEFVIKKYGDIANTIKVTGYNIYEISIIISGMTVWKYVYDDYGMREITIEPFKSGIIILLLQYSLVKIKVKAHIIFSYSVQYIFLDNNIRKLLCNLSATQDNEKKIKIKYNSPDIIPMYQAETYNQMYGCFEFEYTNGIFNINFIQFEYKKNIFNINFIENDNIEQNIKNYKESINNIKIITNWSYRKYAIISNYENFFV